MGYAKEIYQKAQRALEESRAAAQQDAQRRRAALYAELPQLGEIERELSATGLAAAQAAIGGGEDAAKLIERLRARNLALQERRAEILRDAGRPADALAVCLPRLPGHRLHRADAVRLPPEAAARTRLREPRRHERHARLPF